MDRETNLGPLVTLNQKHILQGQVERAITEGEAEMVYGSHRNIEVKGDKL